MYKKSWNSNFQIEDLDIGVKDDPFKDFPFIKLDQKNPLTMEKLTDLLCPPCNSPRGMQDILTGKQEPLENSLRGGWWSHSWPIPLLDKQYFDRRHTVKTLLKLKNRKEIEVTWVPSSNYKRVKVDHEPIISKFDTQSIMIMAGLLGNVMKGDNDASTNDFVGSIVSIIEKEYEKTSNPKIKTKETIQKLLNYMGAYKRFSDAKGYVSTKLLDRIYSTINGNAVKSSSIKTTFNIEKSSMDQFISDNVNWEPHNTETDDYVFRKYAIDTTKDHYRLVCDKIIQTLCALDNDAIKNNETAKTLKVILFCEKSSKFDASHSPLIESARQKFIKWLNFCFYNFNDSITSNFNESFKKYYAENRKKISDFPLEIYFLPQINGENKREAIKISDLDEKKIEFNGLDAAFATREG